LTQKEEENLMTPREKLGFVVGLAQANFKSMRPGDLLNYRDDLSKFLNPDNEQRVVIAPTVPPKPNEYGEKHFRALQKEVRKILREIATGKATRTPSAPISKITVKLGVLSIPHLKSRAADMRMLMVTGKTRDGFLLGLSWLLAHEPVDRIRICKASDCETIFYRNRKQLFCSTRCANRQFQREQREAERGI
jgi:predicted RNA-binding Zn ribbon-like protein